MKKLLFLLLSLPLLLSAQTRIDLDFPSCKYLQYHLALKQGNKLDTIAIGRFDESGKASFTLPDKYTFHRGVANLSVPFGNKNINLILNGENEIALKEIAPDAQDVLVSKSKENILLKELMAKQADILKRYTALMSGSEFQSMLMALPEVQKAALEKEYIDYTASLDKGVTYACRMVRLLNHLSGFGTSLTLSEEEVKQEQENYVVSDLNFSDLYTSGFLDMTLQSWCMSSMVDDSLLVQQSRTMLDRTTDIPIRRELTNEIIKLFSKYGKDNLLIVLGSQYLNIPINGKPAPDLVSGGTPIQPRKALIIFYDSDCNYCRNELYQLKEKYGFLSNDHNRMRIISVSGDTDKDVYKELADTFPWKDKLCDMKGFAGANFANYGVVGSPTLVLVDEEGIVRGRYARLSEFLK